MLIFIYFLFYPLFIFNGLYSTNFDTRFIKCFRNFIYNSDELPTNYQDDEFISYIFKRYVEIEDKCVFATNKLTAKEKLLCERAFIPVNMSFYRREFNLSKYRTPINAYPYKQNKFPILPIIYNSTNSVYVSYIPLEIITLYYDALKEFTKEIHAYLDNLFKNRSHFFVNDELDFDIVIKNFKKEYRLCKILFGSSECTNRLQENNPFSMVEIYAIIPSVDVLLAINFTESMFNYNKIIKEPLGYKSFGMCQLYYPTAKWLLSDGVAKFWDFSKFFGIDEKNAFVYFLPHSYEVAKWYEIMLNRVKNQIRTTLDLLVLYKYYNDIDPDKKFSAIRKYNGSGNSAYHYAKTVLARSIWYEDLRRKKILQLACGDKNNGLDVRNFKHINAEYIYNFYKDLFNFDVLGSSYNYENLLSDAWQKFNNQRPSYSRIKYKTDKTPNLRYFSENSIKYVNNNPIRETYINVYFGSVEGECQKYLFYPQNSSRTLFTFFFNLADLLRVQQINKNIFKLYYVLPSGNKYYITRENELGIVDSYLYVEWNKTSLQKHPKYNIYGYLLLLPSYISIRLPKVEMENQYTIDNIYDRFIIDSCKN